jgi:MFS transporter, DHA1 family, tetracycline resistance protein
MPAETAAGKLPLGSLLLILVIVFINFAGFSLIIPLLPFYGRELGASAVEVTMLFAAYSFGGIFGEIFWGRSSDRLGRKRILILTTACAAVSYVAFAFAATFWLALGIRIVTGFFSGTIGVCQSYIADVTTPQERARSIGYLGAALNLGFVIGPALGGLLAAPERGLRGFFLPILTSAAIAGVAALWSLFVLKESHAPGRARPLPRWGDALHFVASHSLLVRLFAIAFIGIGAFASMEAIFGLWTAANFGWTTHEVGLTFISVGATGFLVQVLLVGRATRRFGEARVIAAGLAVLAVSMLLQPIVRLPVAAVVLMSTLMGGHSIAFPSAGALISRSTPPDVQGSVNGLLMAGNALARIVMPPLLGFAYSAGGPDWPYYLCAGLVGLAFMFGTQVIAIRDGELRAQKAAQI